MVSHRSKGDTWCSGAGSEGPGTAPAPGHACSSSAPATVGS